MDTPHEENRWDRSFKAVLGSSSMWGGPGRMGEEGGVSRICEKSVNSQF